MLKELRRISPWMLLCLPGAGIAAPPASTAGPEQNFWVELRWVQSRVSAAALQGVREQATVVGTAGSVSPRAQTSLSSQGFGATASQPSQEHLPRLLVLNGQTAAVQFSQWQTLQWLDGGMQMDSEVGAASQGAGPASAASAPGPRLRMGGQLRQMPLQQSQGFSITPQWPGGQRPVRVHLRVEQAGGTGEASPPSAQWVSTVVLPLGQWLTVARQGDGAPRTPSGVISSQDARPRIGRELQIRIELAP